MEYYKYDSCKRNSMELKKTCYDDLLNIVTKSYLKAKSMPKILPRGLDYFIR